MADNFYEMVFRNGVSSISKILDDDIDYGDLFATAHSLKGSSGYISANIF